jgi:hypothetical protein
MEKSILRYSGIMELYFELCGCCMPPGLAFQFSATEIQLIRLCVLRNAISVSLNF